MTLLDILVSVSLICIAIGFWRIRANAEVARTVAQQYCKKHELIFVSIHRHKIHLLGQRSGEIDYLMSFTTAPDVAYEGVITIKKQRLIRIDIPVFREPD